MNWLDPFLWILPSYVANASATFSKYFPEPHPIDGGRYLGEERILGDGKTWEGFILGIAAGTLTGLLMGRFIEGLLMGLGALTGDLVGSFIKRRLGLKRGEEAPLLDQIDFLAGTFLFLPPPPEWGVLLLVITPAIHKTANVIGHLWGVKREPW